MLTATLLAITVTAHTRTPPTPRDSSRVIPVILEIRIGTIASTTVSARRIGDTALLPTARILALAELRLLPDADEYLSTDSLSVLLRAPITVDWDDLTAIIADDGALPVSQRAAREQRRELFNMRNTIASTLFVTSRAMPLLPRSLIIDYDIATSSGFARPDARLAIGTNILGGGLNVDWNRMGRSRLGSSTVSWQRDWPEWATLRHVRIGSIPLTGNSRIGTGVFMSTSTVARGDSVEPIRLVGALGRGWEVEAYRDDILVYTGLADSIGAYAVTIPASHGTNRLAIIAHGPYDEQRIINRYVSIGDDMIPARTAAYDMSVGRCEVAGCDYGAELSARYSPLAYITTGVNLSALFASGEHTLEPAVLLAARVHDDVNAAARYGRDGASADFRFAPSPVFETMARYRSTPVNVRLASTGARRSNAILNTIWRPRADRTITASLGLSGVRITDEQRLRIGSSLLLRSTYIRPSVSVVRTVGARSAILSYGVYAESAIPFTQAIGARWRGGLGDANSGDTFLALAMPFARLARVEVGAEWHSGARWPLLTMSMSMITPVVRYEARSVTGITSTTAIHVLSGSVILNSETRAGARRLTLASEPSRGRAEIVGTAFLDGNANGVRDASDQLLSGVLVSIGAASVETDSAGDYRFSDINAFSSVVLSVDSLTLPSPDMIAQPVRVVPIPNGVTRVDLPVVLRASGTSVSGISRIGGLSQYAESCDAPSVHRDHL